MRAILRLAAAVALAGGTLACAPGGESAPASRPATAGFCSNVPHSQYAGLERVEVADDWFEVYRVAPAVYAIYEPFQFQEVISYLILGEGGGLLFDTGMGIGRIRTVVDELTALPVTVFGPESDLAAYRASVARLAELVPELTTLFTAHSTPVAQPSRLLELNDAVEAMFEGIAIGNPVPGGGVEFVFEGFTILLRRDQL